MDEILCGNTGDSPDFTFLRACGRNFLGCVWLRYIVYNLEIRIYFFTQVFRDFFLTHVYIQGVYSEQTLKMGTEDQK